MLEALLPPLFGALMRLVPEVLSMLDRGSARTHELAMMDKQLEADKQRANDQQAVLAANYSTVQMGATLTSQELQFKSVGIPWVDALSTMVRPILAFQWLVVVYPTITVASFFCAIYAGEPALDALKVVAAQIQPFVELMAGYWFLDRTYLKAAR